MSFKMWLRKYLPPLTNEQVEEISTEHERRVSEAVSEAKKPKQP